MLNVGNTSSLPPLASSNGTQWKSPLRNDVPVAPPAPSTSRRRGTVRPKVLFEETPATAPVPKEIEIKEKELEKEAETEPSLESLSFIYKTDFTKLDEKTNATEFFAVREQLLNIENFLVTHRLNKEPIRNRITDVLSGNNYNRKMAELGMILFYLDRDQNLPEVESLVVHRVATMTQEIESYLAAHALACKNPLVASGKTHYLLRAFAHMVFTSSQCYNRGGLIAIREILEHATLEISKYLQPEHRDHILVIINQILSKPSFDHLFQSRGIAVHPNLQDAIRIDLKLVPDERVTSVHAFYGCMMALFADIRQLNSPNCYAISSLIYATENHTYKSLTQMIQWLEEGHYTFSATLKIPIRPLLEKRLIYRRDLQVEVETEKALSLATLGHIAETLSPKLERDSLEKEDEDEKDASSLFGTRDRAPLGQTLSSILLTNEAYEHNSYAEKLYYAYKFNCLVHMQLAILEFAYTNSAGASTLHSSPYSPRKQKFIDACIEILLSTSLKPSPTLRSGITMPEATPSSTEISQDPQLILFMSRLKDKLGERLWLENCNEDTKINAGTLVVGAQRIRSFKGNVLDLSEITNASRRVVYLNSGQYIFLSTITDLQNVISETIEEVRQELTSEDTGAKPIAKTLSDAAQSSDFKKGISTYAAKQIQKVGIPDWALEQADLLIFKQTGGLEDVTLDIVYNISVNHQRVSNCDTPYKFLEKLSNQLKSLDVQLLKSANRLMIATLSDHAWTFSPQSWKLLINNQKPFRKFIQEVIFAPAKRRLNQIIPRETIEKVIERYAEDEHHADRIRSYFREEMSYAQFRDAFLQRTYGKTRFLAEKIVDAEFAKIVFSKQDFYEVLKEMNIEVSHRAFQNIFNRLKLTSLPYRLAQELRLALLEEKVCIKDPYELELAICKTLRLPLPIDVGDMNWSDANREDPYHIRLMIAYNWALGTLSYFVRDSQTERLEQNSFYETYEISYPKVMHRRTEW